MPCCPLPLLAGIAGIALILVRPGRGCAPMRATVDADLARRVTPIRFQARPQERPLAKGEECVARAEIKPFRPLTNVTPISYNSSSSPSVPGRSTAPSSRRWYCSAVLPATQRQRLGFHAAAGPAPPAAITAVSIPSEPAHQSLTVILRCAPTSAFTRVLTRYGAPRRACPREGGG
jgi:hypothetical protein